MIRKTRSFILLFILLSIASLAGCASFGNNRIAKTNQTGLSRKLVRGVTTEAQVRRMFGAPSSTSFTGSGDAIWHYKYAKFAANWQNFVPLYSMIEGGQKETDKNLTILFTRSGVVRNFEMTAGTHEDHAGLF